MKRFTPLLAGILLLSAQAMATTPKTVAETKAQSLLKTPWILLLGLDPANPNNVLPLNLDSSGNLGTFGGGGGSVDQGNPGVATTPWFFTLSRRADGVEFGLNTSPFGVRLFDGAGAAIGGSTNPFSVVGTVGEGVATAGINPVLMGGEDGSGNMAALKLDFVGRLAFQSSAISDGFANTDIVYFGDEGGTAGPLGSALWGFNGTTWDKLRSSVADGLEVDVKGQAGLDLTDIEANTDTATTNDPPVVVSVGTTATLLKAISASRRNITMQNCGTTVIFIGKSGVTTATGFPIGASSVAKDGFGGSYTVDTTDEWFGIVATGTEDMCVATVAD